METVLKATDTNKAERKHQTSKHSRKHNESDSAFSHIPKLMIDHDNLSKQICYFEWVME